MHTLKFLFCFSLAAVFMLRDNSWGFRASFFKASSPYAFISPALYEGSEELRTFVQMCHFMIECLEDKVMDAKFTFSLDYLDEATLR